MTWSLPWPWPVPTTDPALPWDHGVRWKAERIVHPTSQPFDADYLRRTVLRGPDVSSEVEWIDLCIAAATQDAEDHTGRTIMPSTWRLWLDRTPLGAIRVPYPPFIELVSFVSVASDGTETDFGSPSTFRVVPSGQYGHAQILPATGESWPTVSTVELGAVALTYRAGYEDTADPMFKLIKAGIALMVGEMYKQRTLSVHAVHNTPAFLQAQRFWKRVY